MDGREGMGLSGSPPYYLNRGVSGSGPNSGSIFGLGTQTGIAAPPGFKNLPNPHVSVQTNVRASHAGSAYPVDNPSPNFGHGINMGVVALGVPSVDPGKRKRGRPRKYGPDGANMSLGLSPISWKPSPGAITPVEKEKKNRGRPRGSGRKQRLASLGEWMNSSAGLAFTPHVIHIAAGEDISSKILSFAEQRPRALCILSANGSVSVVTFRQPTSGGTVTYEGRFEILCLSGSYLLSEEGGPRNRTGGLSISVCTPDGIVLGGAIGGRLIAASLVQAVVCSFVYDGSKINSNSGADAKGNQNSEVQPMENSSTPTSAAPGQNPAPSSGMAVWPPCSRPDMRDPNTEIDLARG